MSIESKSNGCHRELCYEMVEVINGPGMRNLAALSLSGNTMHFAAAKGLLSTLFTAPHEKLPQLKYVRMC